MYRFVPTKGCVLCASPPWTKIHACVYFCTQVYEYAVDM